MLSFPTSLPTAAITQVTQYLLGTDKDKGKLLLASWQIVGFGLGQAFTGAQLADLVNTCPPGVSGPAPVACTPEHVEAIVACQGDPTKLCELATFNPAVASLLASVIPIVVNHLVDWLKQQK